MRGVSKQLRLGSRCYWRRRAFSASASSSGSGGGERTLKPDEFQRAKRGSFFQPSPELYNTFIEDSFLRRYLKRIMPREVVEDVFGDLEQFGARVSAEIEALGRQAELEPPFLRQYDGWGRRVDELVTSSAWNRLHDIAAEEGLVAIAFERPHRQWSRLHQMVKTYLWAPSSGLYSCPLAMTDGAALLIESTVKDTSPELRRAFSCLTSRDPAQFWTSGQWMTERRGGSDVGQGTDTVAVPQADGSFRLYGYKWFTSATDADMAFTLARVQDIHGEATRGSRGVSLFFLETKTSSGDYNNMELQRLKDKLGTRQLPTAELLLDGTSALMVGPEGRGVAGISPMLTVTRLHNSISASSIMRRVMQLSRDYSTKRTAFGQYLADHPLHLQTLARMEVETRGCTLLSLEIGRLLGLEETGVASSTDRHLLRLLSPVNKLYTAKQAVATVSEGLESFGGAGYLEDTGLPVMLRDAQVLPIWEGTTSILSLDMLRVFQKTGAQEVFGSLVDSVKSRLSLLPHHKCGLTGEAELLQQQLQSVMTFALQALQEGPQCLETAARDLAFSLAHLYTGVLLMEQACWEEASPCDRFTAQRWCLRPLVLGPLSSYTQSQNSADLMLVMDGYQLSSKHTSTAPSSRQP